MTKCVLSEDVEEGLRLVTLNRPERLNAIVPALLEDLVEALEAAERAADVRCIILTGAGRAFCAGDDLREFDSQVGDAASTRAYVERIQDVTRAIMLGSKPVIGAIRGWAVGGGLEWMVSPHWTVKAEYLFVDFGKAATTGFIANPAIAPGYAQGLSTSSDLSASIARAGVNYKF